MARRGHNEGSIHKRLGGRWAGVLNLGWENGKRKRRTYYGKTRREVQELLSKGAVALRAGIRPTPNDRLTLESYFRDWLGDGVQGTVRPSTLRGYASKVSNHIVPALGHVLVSKLTLQMVRGFLSDASQKGLSARTVHHLRAILRAALNDAVRLEIISRNPAALVDSPRIPYQELNPLDPKEARELLQAVSGERLEALYSVALAVGLRQGEALALRWADFDLAEGSLSVRGTLQRFKGRFEISEPKTARSRRTIALPDFAISALRAHHKRQSEERLTAGSAWADWNLVFCDTLGQPLHGPNVTREFQRFLRRNGMRHQRFHDLRHACASLLLAQGVHPRVVMETLGHSNISLTMNTYSHVIPGLQREAASKMDGIFAVS